MSELRNHAWSHRDDLVSMDWKTICDEQEAKLYALGNVLGPENLTLKQIWERLEAFVIFWIAVGVGWGIVAFVGWALWHLPKWLHVPHWMMF